MRARQVRARIILRDTGVFSVGLAGSDADWVTGR